MEERKNIIYTAADLQNYHSGNMSDSEMNALEKAALEDPFLSESLEGYAFTSTAEKDSESLKSRLEQKEKKKKVFVLFSKNNRTWLSAAAILALILGAFYFTLKINSSKNEVSLAKKENTKQGTIQEKKDSSFAIHDQQSPKPIAAETRNEKLNKDRPIEQVESHGKITNTNSKPNTITANSNATVYIEEDADSKKKELSLAKNNLAKKTPIISGVSSATKEVGSRDFADETAFNKSATSIYDSSALDKRQKTNLFSGSVIDDDGIPVPFASISDKKGSKSFHTDSAGKFLISVDDSILPVTFASVGYNVIQKDLRSNIDQTIILSRNKQELTAVIVSAQGQARKKTTNGYSTSVLDRKVAGLSVISTPAPVNGKIKFDKDLHDSIQKSLSLNKQLIKGKVILSFKIKKNGDLKNIRVEKKLCDACDEEAKRLLLAGPKWIYVDDKRTSITITF